jgi:phage terminase Nu1 subunit (DNA packaging protein)
MEACPKYITEVEVHKITGMALSTLRNQRFERRGIPFYRMGDARRSVRYRLDEVISYCEQGRIETGVNR